MANKLPPLPVGTPPGSAYWNDWYEKLRTFINEVNTKIASISSAVSWTIITNKPTTLSGYGITDAQNSGLKNAANGYAGLSSVSRTTKGVDTTDHVVIDSSASGVVLKDSSGVYWKLSIVSGALTVTSLGTTKP
jgi:hypothetical protein